MLLLWFCGLVCLGSAVGAAESEVTRSVRATGFGLIAAGDLAAARAQARQAALREAVEEAIGTLISSHTRVENFEVIEDRILTSTQGYVRRFEMVDHGPIDAHTYQVVIEAVVSLGALHQELDALALLTEAAEVALRYARNLELAHMLVNEVLRINPWYSAAAWNLLGDICWFAEDIDRSEAAYEKAIECNPEHYRGYFNLYTIHRQRGRYDKAVEMAAMALAMDRGGTEGERTAAALEDATRLLRQQRKLAIEWRKARHAGSPL